jgi:hypothetical protein
MHKHDMNPEKGIPYCEFLLAAKRALEERLEHVHRLEATRREVLELIQSVPAAQPEPGTYVPEWPMTDADVRRTIAGKWAHRDGSPLTAEEEVERDRELFAALSDLKYSRLLHSLTGNLNSDVRHAREKLVEWRVYFNQAVRIQAKHESDDGGARNANRTARRSRGRRRR